MTIGCLYIGDSLTDEVALQLLGSDGGIVQVTRHSDGPIDVVMSSLTLNLGSVEGQVRLLDWLRQKGTPARIICELQAFELGAGYEEHTRSATDYLTTQIVGVTRLLEAALSLNPNLVWVFLRPRQADVWSQACEAYFRVLVEGLRIAVPSADFDFLEVDQVAGS